MPDQTTRPDTDPVVAAIDTVARHVLCAAVFKAIEDDRVRDDYPDLSERDWEDVVFRAREMANSLDASWDNYIAAEQLLAARTAPAKEESTCD